MQTTYPQYIVWAGATFTEVFVLVAAAQWGNFRRFWDVYLYLALSCCVSVLRAVLLHHYGLASSEYLYAYYYSDAILTLLLSAIIFRLWTRILPFRKRKSVPFHPVWIFFAATILFAYAMVHQAETKLLTRFVVELSQDLYAADLFLVVILWVAILRKKLDESAEVKLVWVLVITFTSMFVTYYSRQIAPSANAVIVLPQMAHLWLVVGLAFSTLWDDSHVL